MSRPEPIEYAERLYAAIRDANFSPISFLAFGNAMKDGVSLRNMPRVAAEPFMRVVGEMLDLEEDATVIDAEITTTPTVANTGAEEKEVSSHTPPTEASRVPIAAAVALAPPTDRQRTSSKRVR